MILAIPLNMNVTESSRINARKPKPGDTKTTTDKMAAIKPKTMSKARNQFGALVSLMANSTNHVYSLKPLKDLL